MAAKQPVYLDLCDSTPTPDKQPAYLDLCYSTPGPDKQPRPLSVRRVEYAALRHVGDPAPSVTKAVGDRPPIPLPRPSGRPASIAQYAAVYAHKRKPRIANGKKTVVKSVGKRPPMPLPRLGQYPEVRTVKQPHSSSYGVIVPEKKEIKAKRMIPKNVKLMKPVKAQKFPMFLNMGLIKKKLKAAMK